MTEKLKRKLKSRNGAARLIVLLALIAAVLAAIAIVIPAVNYYREESKKIGCATALDTAYRQYIDTFLANGGKLNRDETKEVVTFVMNGWDDLCPAGGNIYIVEDNDKGEGLFRLVCGIHGSDEKELTRLNAGFVLDTVREKIAEAQKNGRAYPKSVTLTLNGKELTARLTDKPTGLKRGTESTSGYEGTVAFYSIVGHSDFGEDSGMDEGKIWYFSFADEKHCAEWTYAKSWTGDSYR